MTKKELIKKIEHLRDDDPVVIYVEDNVIYPDIYDFIVEEENIDVDYTEIRLKLIPN